jgi:hypothetical protein
MGDHRTRHEQQSGETSYKTDVDSHRDTSTGRIVHEFSGSCFWLAQQTRSVPGGRVHEIRSVDGGGRDGWFGGVLRHTANGKTAR